MLEKIPHIRNPLTIIALFSGITEVFGVLVLPLLFEKNQTVFMYFLMLFPVLLVVLFYGTLWFKHYVLYAPSDFKNEDNFVRLFPSTFIEKNEKIKEDVANMEPGQRGKQAIYEDVDDGFGVRDDAQSLTKKHTKDNLEQEKSRSLERIQKYKDIEDLVFQKLSMEFGRNLYREVKLSPKSLYVWDGVYYKDSCFIAVEVKLANRRVPGSVLNKVKQAADEAKRLLGLDYIVVVFVCSKEEDADKYMKDAKKIFNGLPVDVRVYSYSQIGYEV